MKHSKTNHASIKENFNAHLTKFKAEFLTLADADFYFTESFFNKETVSGKKTHTAKNYQF
jgi:hypothetical protein